MAYPPLSSLPCTFCVPLEATFTSHVYRPYNSIRCFRFCFLHTAFLAHPPFSSLTSSFFSISSSCSCPNYGLCSYGGAPNPRLLTAIVKHHLTGSLGTSPILPPPADSPLASPLFHSVSRTPPSSFSITVVLWTFFFVGTARWGGDPPQRFCFSSFSRAYFHLHA